VVAAHGPARPVPVAGSEQADQGPVLHKCALSPLPRTYSSTVPSEACPWPRRSCPDCRTPVTCRRPVRHTLRSSRHPCANESGFEVTVLQCVELSRTADSAARSLHSIGRLLRHPRSASGPFPAGLHTVLARAAPRFSLRRQQGTEGNICSAGGGLNAPPLQAQRTPAQTLTPSIKPVLC
jgi:hypothetical protein